MSTGELTRRALAHKRSKGERTSRDAPFGYRIADDEKTLLKDKGEQKIVKLVVSLREEGMSYRKIADRLNTDGIPARGAKWHATTITRLLTREARKGYLFDD